MKFYRRTGVLKITPIYGQKPGAFFQFSPALDPKRKGKPKAGEKIYDYEAGFTWAASPQELITLGLIAQDIRTAGTTTEETSLYHQSGDKGKSVRLTPSKSSSVPSSKGTAAFIAGVYGKVQVAISLTRAELFTLECLFPRMAFDVLYRAAPPTESTKSPRTGLPEDEEWEGATEEWEEVVEDQAKPANGQEPVPDTLEELDYATDGAPRRGYPWHRRAHLLARLASHDFWETKKDGLPGILLQAQDHNKINPSQTDDAIYQYMNGLAHRMANRQADKEAK